MQTFTFNALEPFWWVRSVYPSIHFRFRMSGCCARLWGQSRFLPRVHFFLHHADLRHSLSFCCCILFSSVLWVVAFFFALYVSVFRVRMWESMFRLRTSTTGRQLTRRVSFFAWSCTICLSIIDGVIIDGVLRKRRPNITNSVIDPCTFPVSECCQLLQILHIPFRWWDLYLHPVDFNFFLFSGVLIYHFFSLIQVYFWICIFQRFVWSPSWSLWADSMNSASTSRHRQSVGLICTVSCRPLPCLCHSWVTLFRITPCRICLDHSNLSVVVLLQEFNVVHWSIDHWANLRLRRVRSSWMPSQNPLSRPSNWLLTLCISAQFACKGASGPFFASCFWNHPDQELETGQVCRKNVCMTNCWATHTTSVSCRRSIIRGLSRFFLSCVSL